MPGAATWNPRAAVCSNGVILGCMLMVKDYTIVPVVLVHTLMIEMSCAAHSCPSIKFQCASYCGVESLCMRQGQTPLHYAVIHNHLEVVHLLIKYGANMTVVDDEVCYIILLNSQ